MLAVGPVGDGSKLLLADWLWKSSDGENSVVCGTSSSLVLGRRTLRRATIISIDWCLRYTWCPVIWRDILFLFEAEAAKGSRILRAKVLTNSKGITKLLVTLSADHFHESSFIEIPKPVLHLTSILWIFPRASANYRRHLSHRCFRQRSKSIEIGLLRLLYWYHSSIVFIYR